MDSTTLEDLGFRNWSTFDRSSERSLLETLPKEFGVYAVLLPESQSRLRGQSDIAYIGRAANQNGLRGRVRQYYHPGPTQSTNIAMKRRLAGPVLGLRLGYVVTATVASAKRLESELILRFKAEHGEWPPFNRTGAFDLTPATERDP